MAKKRQVHLTAAEAKKLEGDWELLHWNQRKGLAHLLTIEEHMKDLSTAEIPDSWCIVKHFLLLLDHHVEEAIGHTQRVGVDPKPYIEFKRKLEETPLYPVPMASLNDVVALRSEWRKIIGDPTLTGDCKLCSADAPPSIVEAAKAQEAVEKGNKHPVGNRHPVSPGLGDEILGLERDYATRVLEAVARARGRDEYPFMIVNCGKEDPSGKAIATVNERGEPFIAACGGGINAHTLLHEASHLDDEAQGKCNLRSGDCPEESAEYEALRELSNSSVLNTHPIRRRSGDKMVHLDRGKTKEVVGIYGASIVAKAVQRGAKELDKTYTTPLFGLTGTLGKPSFWINVAGAALPPLIYLVLKKKTSRSGGLYFPLMILSGSMLANTLIEYGEAIMNETSAPAASLRPVSVIAPTAYVPRITSGNGGATVF